ncbi:hypothetical protein R3P38DRAFT_3379990 [Favolaschia claudopus]|uniref:Uncharacterized protein n=1 Tax=Favolaschia claudopus TaxID=2862362 RepID=A0AAV9Z3P7_9AGAR
MPDVRWNTRPPKRWNVSVRETQETCKETNIGSPLGSSAEELRTPLWISHSLCNSGHKLQDIISFSASSQLPPTPLLPYRHYVWLYFIYWHSAAALLILTFTSAVSSRAPAQAGCDPTAPACLINIDVGDTDADDEDEARSMTGLLEYAETKITRRAATSNGRGRRRKGAAHHWPTVPHLAHGSIHRSVRGETDTEHSSPTSILASMTTSGMGISGGEKRLASAREDRMLVGRTSVHDSIQHPPAASAILSSSAHSSDVRHASAPARHLGLTLGVVLSPRVMTDSASTAADNGEEKRSGAREGIDLRRGRREMSGPSGGKEGGRRSAKLPRHVLLFHPFVVSTTPCSIVGAVGAVAAHSQMSYASSSAAASQLHSLHIGQRTGGGIREDEVTVTTDRSMCAVVCLREDECGARVQVEVEVEMEGTPLCKGAKMDVGAKRKTLARLLDPSVDETRGTRDRCRKSEEAEEQEYKPSRPLRHLAFRILRTHLAISTTLSAHVHAAAVRRQPRKNKRVGCEGSASAPDPRIYLTALKHIPHRHPFPVPPRHPHPRSPLQSPSRQSHPQPSRARVCRCMHRVCILAMLETEEMMSMRTGTGTGNREEDEWRRGGCRSPLPSQLEVPAFDSGVSGEHAHPELIASETWRSWSHDEVRPGASRRTTEGRGATVARGGVTRKWDVHSGISGSERRKSRIAVRWRGADVADSVRRGDEQGDVAYVIVGEAQGEDEKGVRSYFVADKTILDEHGQRRKRVAKRAERTEDARRVEAALQYWRASKRSGKIWVSWNKKLLDDVGGPKNLLLRIFRRGDEFTAV